MAQNVGKFLSKTYWIHSFCTVMEVHLPPEHRPKHTAEATQGFMENQLNVSIFYVKLDYTWLWTKGIGLM